MTKPDAWTGETESPLPANQAVSAPGALRENTSGKRQEIGEGRRPQGIAGSAASGPVIDRIPGFSAEDYVLYPAAQHLAQRDETQFGDTSQVSQDVVATAGTPPFHGDSSITDELTELVRPMSPLFAVDAIALVGDGFASWTSPPDEPPSDVYGIIPALLPSYQWYFGSYAYDNPSSCCDVVLAQLVNGGSRPGGIVACCNGVKVICIWEEHIRRADARAPIGRMSDAARAKVRKCLGEHEETHKDDVECPWGGMYQAVWKTGMTSKQAAAEEQKAHKKTIECAFSEPCPDSDKNCAEWTTFLIDPYAYEQWIAYSQVVIGMKTWEEQVAAGWDWGPAPGG